MVCICDIYSTYNSEIKGVFSLESFVSSDMDVKVSCFCSEMTL